MVAASRPLPIGQPAAVSLPWPLDLPPIGMVFVSVVCVAVAALLYLTQASRVATSGYDLAALESQLGHLQRERQQLLIELAGAQSIGHVDTAAANALGMMIASDETFLPAGNLSAVLDIEAAIRAGELAAAEKPPTWRERLGTSIGLAQSRLGGLFRTGGAEVPAGPASAPR